MSSEIVITGIGLITPLGIGREASWEAMLEGKSGIAQISGFDVAPFRSRLAAEVRDFDAAQLLGRKGLQYLNRSMTFGCAAAKLAMEDAGLTVTEENRSRIGVSIGTSMSGLTTECKFDQQALVEGPRYVNPMLFPSTGPSAPPCQVSIMFGVDAFNTTITNGISSGLDAIGYALNFIRMGRADVVLAGGVEEFSYESFLGYYLSNALSGSDADGGEEFSAPFDRRRNGAVMGEGCALLVLESLEHALERGADIYARVRGYASAFDLRSSNGYNSEARGAARAIGMALNAADIKPAEIDLVCASANSSPTGDAMEVRAINEVFGAGHRARITAIKSMVGESCGAGGAIESAVAALSISRGKIPPTINYAEADPACRVDTLVTERQEAEVRAALINSFGWSGHNASLVMTA